MKLLIITAIVVGLCVAGYGLWQWARREIAASREGLRHVDRSKLRDLDKDAWAEEERRREAEEDDDRDP